MSHNDWHLNSEQLSTLLDGQLSPDEQNRFQVHLRTCQQCQLRLADLRQTVTLLHALPQPPLPRSFTLPVGDAVVTPIAAYRNSANSKMTTQARRPARRGYIRTTMRTLSAIAAVLGMIFLLSTALPLVQGSAIHPTAASSAQPAKSTAGSSKPAQGGQSLDNATPHTTLTPRAATPRATASLPATATPEATAQVPHPVTPVHAPLPDLNNTAERALLGLVLLIAGLLSFILFSRRKMSKQ